jgi:hypothetical protein
MTIVLIVFLGGVLPFVFARSEQRFLTNGLPLLAGMAVTFAGIATLAAVGGAWAVRVNQYGRLLTDSQPSLRRRRLSRERRGCAGGGRRSPRPIARDLCGISAG